MSHDGYKASMLSNRLLNVKPASFTKDTVTTMSDQAEQATSQEIPRIPSYRYTMVIHEMTLLRSMEVLTNDEVKRLISQLKSPDPENWHVAEECIKQKLS